MIADLWVLIGLIIIIFGKIGVTKSYLVEGTAARLIGATFIVSAAVIYSGKLGSAQAGIVVLLIPVVMLFIFPAIFSNTKQKPRSDGKIEKTHVDLQKTKNSLQSKIRSARRGGIISTTISGIVIIVSWLKIPSPEVIIMISMPFLLFGLFLLYQVHTANKLMKRDNVNREG